MVILNILRKPDTSLFHVFGDDLLVAWKRPDL